MIESRNGVWVAVMSAGCRPATQTEIEMHIEMERIRQNAATAEDEHIAYLDYVGDALGQAEDGESLLGAAQRVLSERDRMRAENEALRNCACSDCNVEVLALRAALAEIDALRQSAERYIYLRDERRLESLHLRGTAAGVWCDCEDEDGALTLLTGDDLDAAVDAARNAG
jgi:hypothetical protein